MAKAKDDKPIETGSVLGRTLQEKQVAALDKARKALESSVDGYTSIIEKLNNELNDVYYKIQEKETLLKEIERDQVSQRLATVEELDNKITQLEKSFDTKIKDFQVSFDLAKKASKEDALRSLLGEFSLAYISKDDLQEVRGDLNSAMQALEAGYKEEIAKVTARNQRIHNGEIKELKLTHEKNQAKLEAANENSSKQIEFYREQLEAAKQQVRDILDNQVEVARATKAVNINSGAAK